MGAELERDAPVREGDVLAGRYRVERVLAIGGMGVVVAARHVTLNQRVAVKVLTHNAGSSQSNARFLTEAKASAILRGDHVVHVSDVGTLDNGQPFMVMELLEGEDLSQVLEKEGRQTVERAADWVLQACEGLAEAHAARIVHRDLKPGNLFRARRPDGSDVIKVLDFGVSKALSADVRAEGTVTTTDAVFGSPLYMPPEQMQSASKADERSDIWSLGVVLYELVTGHMPFDAESMAGLAVRIATDPPTRMTQTLPTVPPELEAVVFKCLEKKPDARYPNVAELAADLEPFVPGARDRVERIQRLVFGTTSPPRPAPSAPSLRRLPAGAETLGPLDTGDSSAPRIFVPEKRRSPWPIAAGVAVVAAAAFAGAMFVRGGPRAATPAPQPHASAPTMTLATQPTTPAASAPPAASVTRVDPAPTTSDAPKATPTTAPHVVHHKRHAPKVHASPPPTDTSMVISGISRDRK